MNWSRSERLHAPRANDSSQLRRPVAWSGTGFVRRAAPNWLKTKRGTANRCRAPEPVRRGSARKKRDVEACWGSGAGAGARLAACGWVTRGWSSEEFLNVRRRAPILEFGRQFVLFAGEARAGPMGEGATAGRAGSAPRAGDLELGGSALVGCGSRRASLRPRARARPAARIPVSRPPRSVRGAASLRRAARSVAARRAIRRAPAPAHPATLRTTGPKSGRRWRSD
jgi:hypothetical protein